MGEENINFYSYVTLSTYLYYLEKSCVEVMDVVVIFFSL